jgi:phasin family protein
MAAEKKSDNENAHREQVHHEEPSSNPTMDIFSMFTHGKFGIDRDELINNHRKNLEAMNDASKMAMDVMKTITTLQSQYIKQTFDDFTAIIREISQKPLSADSLKNQSSRLKESVSKAVDHTSTLANIIVKSNGEFYKKMQNNMNESFEEMKYQAAGKKKH